MQTRIETTAIIMALIACAFSFPGCDREGQVVVISERLPVIEEDEPEWLADVPTPEFREFLRAQRMPIAKNNNYSPEDLAILTAEVEHMPGEFDDKVKSEWDQKWESQLIRYDLTGGCGCCNEVYTVTGPRAAIEEFPIHPGRRKYYPRYHDVVSNE